MFFGVSLAAAGSCIYIRTRGGIVSRPQSQTDSVSNSYTYRTRNQKLVCQDIKIKRQKEAALLQGDGPDFGGPFTRMSHVRLARPGERARACGFPFLFSHTTWSGGENPLYKEVQLFFNFQGGTKLSTTTCHFTHGL